MKFILAEEKSKIMFIPDEIRKCVVYVGYELPSGELSLQGTAFLTARAIEGTNKSFHYLVTAKHVIQGISSLENFDGKIVLRVNTENEEAITVSTDASKWLFHPEETEVDVAVLPFVTHLSDIADVLLIPNRMFLTEQIKVEEEISIGDEVFLTGLFYNHHGRRRNIPIVRVGNISAMPEEKVYTKMGLIDAYLIEARSIGGISGSPVFVHLGVDRKVEEGKILVSTGQRGRGPFYLLGLMHGHYNIDLLKQDSVDMDMKAREIVNMGIAIVVPVEKIAEVINQPIIRDQEDLLENKLREEMRLLTNTVD